MFDTCVKLGAKIKTYNFPTKFFPEFFYDFFVHNSNYFKYICNLKSVLLRIADFRMYIETLYDQEIIRNDAYGLIRLAQNN